MNRHQQLTFSGLTALALLSITGNAVQAVTPSDIDTAAATESMGQVNSVFQLRDVAPSDQAFDALRNLVEKYNCLAGYPNGTFRGDRPLSRYEFAAGLNACLQQIERLITGENNNSEIATADITRLRALVQEFDTELATLGARVDDLDGRVAFLEDNQFSTTTQLKGQVSFALAQAFGDQKADGTDLDSQVVFNNRVRLFFNTSFTGKDLLITRLDALNTVPFGPGEGGEPNVTGTSMTRTAFDEGNGNNVGIGKLFYGFSAGSLADKHDDAHGEDDHHDDEHDDHDDHGHGPAKGARWSFAIDAVGGEFNENFVNFNEFFSEELTGSVSRFGRFNPIYYQGLEGTGASLTYRFSNALSFSVGYLAPEASSPSRRAGLFDGSNATLAQFTLEPSDDLALGLTYARSYFPGGGAIAVSGETGSEAANVPFGEDIATSADSFGIQGRYEINPRLSLSGWAGLTEANAEQSGVNADANNVAVNQGDSATTFNWAVTLAMLDVGGEGNLLGFIVGQPPRVTDNDAGTESSEAAWHIETQYRHQINDHIAINPGIFVVLNPENQDQDSIVVGTIRTIFEF